MSPERRDQLAAQQAALVEALAGRSPAPADFDAGQLTTAAASLLAKRRRGAEKTWPGLTESLGDRFRPAFADYARRHPLPSAGSHADGTQFARYLRRRGELSDDGRLQLLLAELGPRRPVGVAFLPTRRTLVLAVRAFGGARSFTVRLPRLRRGGANFSQPLSPAPK